MTMVNTAAFWRATGARVLYTFLSALLPYVILVQTGQVSIMDALSISALAGVASLVTALANLPEITTATMPLWKAILHRTLRTLGQNVAAGLAGVLLLQDVPWEAVAIGALGAVVATLVRTFLDVLPESVAQAPAVELVQDQTGDVTAGEASNLPTGEHIGTLHPGTRVGANVLEALDFSAADDGK